MNTSATWTKKLDWTGTEGAYYVRGDGRATIRGSWWTHGERGRRTRSKFYRATIDGRELRQCGSLSAAKRSVAVFESQAQQA